ncbi:hypothetical protein [Azotobacter chroococcum]|nr:hypothetical protein [Azotobacter chroococcum]
MTVPPGPMVTSLGAKLEGESMMLTAAVAGPPATTRTTPVIAVWISQK